jgi:hypothetical protein
VNLDDGRRVDTHHRYAAPQPNFVPVSPRVSRNVQSSGMSGTTSSRVFAPFTVRVTLAIRPNLCSGTGEMSRPT